MKHAGAAASRFLPGASARRRVGAIRDRCWSTWHTRIPAVALVLAAFILHCAAAAHRTANLLEHDEAISLLAAAGNAERIDRLLDGPQALCTLGAGDLQQYLRPAEEATAGDVVRSLAHRDTHPPLYFLILHELEKWGIRSLVSLRLFGTIMILIAAWCANRWVWPSASPPAKLLATAWVLMTPAMVGIATELRQYALVYLGVVLSIAALVKFREEARPARHTVMLLAISPVVLGWSQYGTMIWVAICLLVSAVCLGERRARGWPVLAGAVVAAGLMLVPVLLWGYQSRFDPRGFSADPLTNPYGDGLLPLAHSLVEAWLPLPWRLQQTVPPPVIAGMFLLIAAILLLAVAVLAWGGSAGLDRRLWFAAALWLGTWLLLLARGWIPAHAVEPKQLAPLVLVPVCLLARACSATRPAWVRRSAMVLLAVSILAGAPRMLELLSKSADRQLIASLGSADCLLADAPRRGYVMPLVEKMAPAARVVLVAPPTALERWTELEMWLPDGRLLLAEINWSPGQPRPASMQQVVDRLSARYRQQATLRKEPRRTVTEFKEKLSAVSH